MQNINTKNKSNEKISLLLLPTIIIMNCQPIPQRPRTIFSNSINGLDLIAEKGLLEHSFDSLKHKF